MEIVRVGPESVDDWNRLRAELWPEWPPAEIPPDSAALLSREDAVAFLATEDAEPIGFAEARLRRDPVNGCTTSPVAFLEGIYVHPDHRRRGIARALFAAVETWAIEHGMTEIGSDTLLENTDSQHLHAALGFAETERIVFFQKALRS